MRITVRRTLSVTLVLGMLASGLALWSAAAGPQMSETSSAALAAQPSPTYVSELAPAVSVAARQAASLPGTGGAGKLRSAMPVPKVAGLALALAGLVLIQAGLRQRPGRAT